MIQPVCDSSLDAVGIILRIGACAPQPMADLMPILQDHFGDMTISSELVYGEKLLSGIKNGTYQIGIVRAPIEDSGLFFQRYTAEHLFVVLPEGHRLSEKESVRFSDLAGEKFLLYQHIGFWKSVCEEYMSETAFLIQPDRDTFSDLVMNTDYPAFSSDIILDKQGVMKGRIAIPIDEEKSVFMRVCELSTAKTFRRSQIAIFSKNRKIVRKSVR